jgi:hypothetical protein
MTTPLHFAEVVADPLASPVAVADAARSAGPSGTWPSSPLLDGWKEVVDQLARLDAATTYVGTFRLAMDAAADGARRLDERDRRAVVLLVLQQTARRAATVAEFEHGLRAARRIAPDGLLLDDLVPAVAWVCADVARQVDDDDDPIVLGLPAALALLTMRGGPWLHDDHGQLLHELLLRLPGNAVRALGPTIDRLHPRDRRIVRDALSPAGHHRRRLIRR